MKSEEEWFAKACSDRTGVIGLKLKEIRLTLDIKKKFLAVRLARHWNKLIREVLDAPFLGVIPEFKARLHGALSTLV